MDFELGSILLGFDLWSILKNISESSSKVMINVALPPSPMVSLYSVVRDRLRRDIRPPKMDGEADFVVYALVQLKMLSLAKNIL